MNLLSPTQVSDKLGISKAALAAMRRRVDTFPKPIKVSQKVLRWDEEEINRWLEARKESANEDS